MREFWGMVWVWGRVLMYLFAKNGIYEENVDYFGQ
jgi:hypothetical protein